MTTTFFSPSYIQRRAPLAGALDDLLQGFLVRPSQTTPATATRSFKLDVREQGNTYQVAAELPGLKKDDIKIEIDGAQVSISAQYPEDTAGKEDPAAPARVVYRERSAGPVARIFELPVEIDQTAASAKYEDGILKLSLPKKVAETRKLLAVH